MLVCGVGIAQHPIPMHNLWARPQVHVVFGEYKVSFTIKDINKALMLLRQTSDSLQVTECGLDTAKDYYYELFPGSHTQYKTAMEPLLQNLVGPFLLSAGHALVERKHKPLKEVIMDTGQVGIGETDIFISFFDPKNRTMLFSGKMNIDMYKKDLGIDD